MAINDMLGVPRGNIGTNIPLNSPFYEYQLIIGGTTSAPTAGTLTMNKALWRRVGERMEISYTYIQTANGAAGSGTYLYPIPAGFTIDTTLAAAGTTRAAAATVGWAYNNTSQPSDNIGIVSIYNNKNLWLSFTTAVNSMSVWGSSGPSIANVSVTICFTALIPIVEFRLP